MIGKPRPMPSMRGCASSSLSFWRCANLLVTLRNSELRLWCSMSVEKEGIVKPCFMQDCRRYGKKDYSRQHPDFTRNNHRMAPVYTTQALTTTGNTNPTFSFRGLDNQKASPISTQNLFGIPLEKQVAFTEYSSNISAFISATAFNKTVYITGRPYGPLPSTTAMLPLRYPALHFTLQKSPSDTVATRMISMLGEGASFEKTKNNVIFKTLKPSVNTFSQILPLSNPSFVSGPDSVNPSGFEAYIFLSRAINTFLRVHTYSAFGPNVADKLVAMRTLITKDALPGTGRYKLQPDSVASRTIATVDLDAMYDDHGETSRALATQLASTAHFFETTGNDTVVHAKPSPAPTSAINIGPVSSVPDGPGLVFPYFHQLVRPDDVGLKTFVYRRLFELLGNTGEACRDRFSKLRRGIQSLATTPAGMELSHITLGIELALQTQGRCFLLVDNDIYQGFVLLGDSFCINSHSKWIAPVESAFLRADLSHIDPHAKALVSLSSLLASMIVSGSYVGQLLSSEELDSPKVIAGMIDKVVKTKITKEEESEFNRLLCHLNFGGKGFLANNPQKVAEMLEILFGDADVQIDRPTYFSSVKDPISSKAYVLLSRFGPEAPSLWNERGDTYPCIAKATTSKTGEKRKIDETGDYEHMPKSILITPKPLSIAVRDMEKVMKSGTIRMDLKERAGRFRNVCVEDETMRKRIWKALVNGSVNTKRQRKEEPAGKAVTENYDDLLLQILGEEVGGK